MELRRLVCRDLVFVDIGRQEGFKTLRSSRGSRTFAEEKGGLDRDAVSQLVEVRGSMFADITTDIIPSGWSR